MIKSLFSGITGLQANTERLGVIGDNIANVGTTGFKGGRMDFANLLSQSVGGFTGQEVGSGVEVGKLSRDFTQGSLMTTGNVTDLAINGKGFFAVRTVDAGGVTEVGDANVFFTRAGSFHFDENGFLVDNNGYRVRGVGDVDIQLTAPIDTASITIATDGRIMEFTEAAPNGNEIGQIGLTKFTSEWGLAAMDRNLYQQTAASGTIAGGTAVMDAPGAAGRGTVSSYSLEMSNVDLAKEFGDMITTQRSFQAAAKVVTASDEVLQQLLGIKR